MRGIPDLARFFRFRLRLHGGWAIAFILLPYSMVTQFPADYPLWQRAAAGIVASLLFFVAVSVREIALNFLALSRDIPVRRATLFVFGGVFQLAKEDTFPALELLLAMAGLLYNLVVATIFYGVHSVLINTSSVLIDGLVLWLAYLYFLLALFHFIPVLPLDMGRLSRALIWKATDNYERSTSIFSWVGQGVGLAFIAWGILILVMAHQWFNGLMLVLLGWSLFSSAGQSRHPATLRQVLQDIRARDVMVADYQVISRRLSLGQLVRDSMLVSGHRYFIVADGSKLEGIVSMSNIKRVPKKRWDSTTIAEIMLPVSKLRTTRLEQPAARLLEHMNEWHLDHIPVLAKGRVAGIVVRDNLRRLVKTRTELKC